MQRIEDEKLSAEEASKKIYELAIAASSAQSKAEKKEKREAIIKIALAGHAIDRDLFRNPVTRQLIDAGYVDAAIFLIEYLGADPRYLANYYGKNNKNAEFQKLLKRHPYTYVWAKYVEGVASRPDVSSQELNALIEMGETNGIFSGRLIAISRALYGLLIHKPILFEDMKKTYAAELGEEGIASIYAEAGQKNNYILFAAKNIFNKGSIIIDLISGGYLDAASKLLREHVGFLLFREGIIGAAAQYGWTEYVNQQTGEHVPLMSMLGYGAGGFHHEACRYMDDESSFMSHLHIQYLNHGHVYPAEAIQPENLDELMIKDSMQYEIQRLRTYCLMHSEDKAEALFKEIMDDDEFRFAKNIRKKMEESDLSFDEARESMLDEKKELESCRLFQPVKTGERGEKLTTSFGYGYNS